MKRLVNLYVAIYSTLVLGGLSAALLGALFHYDTLLLIGSNVMFSGLALYLPRYAYVMWRRK